MSIRTIKDNLTVIILARGLNGLGVIRGLYLRNIRTIVITDSSKDTVMYSRLPLQKIILKNNSEVEILKILGMYYDKGYVLIGTSDEYMSVLSKNEQLLKNHFHLILPETRVINCLLNKKEEIIEIQNSNIPLPKSIVVFPDDPKEIIEELTLPLIIKPKLSTFTSIIGKKNVIVKYEKDLFAFYSSYNSDLQNFIIQEIIPGGDENLWVINCFFGDHGKLLQHFIFQRLGTSPSHYGVTSYARSQTNESLRLEVEKLGIQLNYSGPAMVEFKYDCRDGLFKYIEINPRLGMCNFFDTRCGINNVYATYLYSIGQIDKLPPSRQRDNIIYINLFPDFISRIKSNEPLSSIFKRYFSNLSKTHFHAYWWWKDPLPALMNYRNFLRSIYYVILRLVVRR